jgi:ABC-type nickel/cobalt efflux system permease component RcnA
MKNKVGLPAQQELSFFLGVIVFGLLHGLNPSHGWIVAVLYSIRKISLLLEHAIT